MFHHALTDPLPERGGDPVGRFMVLANGKMLVHPA